METFDPWPHVKKKTDDQQLTKMQRLQLQFALDLDSHRPTTGFDVLREAVRCAGAGIPAPDWLARDMQTRFQQVTQFSARSLDDPIAFGPTPRIQAGDQLRTAALRAKWGQMLEILFAPGAPLLPRTPTGHRKAAEMLGLTAKQVRTLTPTTRSNKKGHKPYRAEPASAGSAHDPFSLAHKKRPTS
jgi:hypothetical protein